MKRVVGLVGIAWRAVGWAELQPVLVWPADPLRGRVYMYLLNKKGEKLGFCKLGLDERNNALIEREQQALEHLQSMDLKLSRIQVAGARKFRWRG